MTPYGLICLLLGAMAWGQAAPSTSAPASQKPAATASGQTSSPAAEKSDENKESEAAKVAPEAPVITIDGLCDNPPADKSAESGCKTVITRAEFEKLVDAVQPSMPARARRQFANRYASALVMQQKAHEMGLDHGEQFDERMKIAKVQVMAQQLNQAMQEKAGQISDKDIEDYYRAHIENYQEADVKRVYIPRVQQPADSKTKLSDAEEQKRVKTSEETMKKEADKLRARAAAGEDFTKLQDEAFQVAGIKSKAPNPSMGKMRRSSLPPSQAAAMDLKTGEVSQVMSDQSGYFIYKLENKDTLSEDKVKEEIRGALRSQRMQDSMHSIQEAATPQLDEAYFGPEAPARPSMMGPGGPPMSQPTKPPAPGPK